MYRVSQFISTCCYLGYIKYLPGTIGSLLAFPFSYVILKYLTILNITLPISQYDRTAQYLLSVLIIFLAIVLVLFFLGVWASNVYMNHTKTLDPSEIIIDELVGQMLVIILSSMTLIIVPNSWIKNYLSHTQIYWLFQFLIPLIFFRALDIIKPWPINVIDRRCVGGFGVMLDDVVAAMISSLLIYSATLLLVSY